MENRISELPEETATGDRSPEKTQTMEKECIVLAGGLGTRLRGTVDDVPKCMAPVAGRPFLHYLFDYLERNGFSRVVLSLGYMHETVERWAASQVRPFRIAASVEPTPLGTGGAIALAAEKTTGRQVYVMNGDTFFDADTDAMRGVHEHMGAAATLALKPMNDFSRYGTVETDDEGRIRTFREKRHCRHGLINGGIYLLDLESGLFDGLGGRFSFETDVLQARVSGTVLGGYVSAGYFIDIGVPEDYRQANADFEAMFAHDEKH